jgi:hypothetical protein
MYNSSADGGSMPAFLLVAVLLSLLSSSAMAQVVVFWQPGFPTIASQPVERATLSFESNQKAVAFHDVRSGKDFSGQLENGRAALLLVSDEGKLLATYNWPQ